MSVLFDPHEVGINGQANLRKAAPRPLRRKEDDLLVFGYGCKLFENSQKAASFDEEKSLIPWMGDESLLIDRYDARLLFTDKTQFVSKPSEVPPSLTPEEEEIERHCDHERYLDLHQDSREYELLQEEEMKRFQQALREDGAYNSVAFSYDYSAPEHSFQYPQSDSSYQTTHSEGSLLYQARQANSIKAPSPQEMASPSQTLPQPPPLQQPEPFVPPEELEIPSDMEIPETAKMQAIIERTAVFVAKQGKQMEILVKAKQSGNPQFDFLLIDSWLNPYYQHVLKYIMEGKYTPVIPKPPSPQPQEEAQESESEDESDGEYELHPLLQASLHKKVTRSQPSSASSSPLPDTLGNKFSRTFAPITEGASPVTVTQDNGGTHDLQNYSEMNESFDYSMWYLQEDMYGHYGSSAGYQYHPPVAPVLSVADLIPPPPPPPGEGPLEEEWLDSTSSVPPLPPPPPPPAPPGIFLPSAVEIPEPLPPPPPPPGVAAVPLVSEQIIPPPPDLQPIVDKLANYVAKNGPDFESIIKAKNDPRFEFLNPWNSHYSYYQLKKQQAVEAAQQRTETVTENEKSQLEVSKGPISFSIKAKDAKKPKIEYRTSVIYKQSYEQGQSDEEAEEADSEADSKETPQVSGGKESVDKQESSSSTPETSEQSLEDLNQQMDSIKAAERIAQHLESESRDKQLQLERRRKASLFISMLKKTNPGDEVEANQSSSANSAQSGKTRKFVESKQEKRWDSPAAKRSRVDDDSDDESVSRGGLGIPSPDSIRVTQDLMAKVLAASRNK